jgi:hypothetical protein
MKNGPDRLDPPMTAGADLAGAVTFGFHALFWNSSDLPI